MCFDSQSLSMSLHIAMRPYNCIIIGVAHNTSFMLCGFTQLFRAPITHWILNLLLPIFHLAVSQNRLFEFLLSIHQHRSFFAVCTLGTRHVDSWAFRAYDSLVTSLIQINTMFRSCPMFNLGHSCISNINPQFSAAHCSVYSINAEYSARSDCSLGFTPRYHLFPIFHSSIP